LVLRWTGEVGIGGIDSLFGKDKLDLQKKKKKSRAKNKTRLKFV
jgi:hypothetical protein